MNKGRLKKKFFLTSSDAIGDKTTWVLAGYSSVIHSEARVAEERPRR